MHLTIILMIHLISSELIYNIKSFNANDLDQKDPLLVYIYYERKNYICPICKIISREIEKLTNIEIRKLNMYDDPFNGSRFSVIFFPAIIIVDHGRSHYTEISNHKSLQEIIDNKSWSHKDCEKFYNNPKGCVVYCYAISNYLFYSFLKRVYSIADFIPSWMFSIVIGLMLSIVIIVFVQFLIECFTKREKEKEE